MPVFFGGHSLPPLDEIELIDLLKSGDAMVSPTVTDTLRDNRPVSIASFFVCFKGRITPLPDESDPYLRATLDIKSYLPLCI